MSGKDKEDTRNTNKVNGERKAKKQLSKEVRRSLSRSDLQAPLITVQNCVQNLLNQRGNLKQLNGNPTTRNGVTMTMHQNSRKPATNSIHMTQVEIKYTANPSNNPTTFEMKKWQKQNSCSLNDRLKHETCLVSPFLLCFLSCFEHRPQQHTHA